MPFSLEYKRTFFQFKTNMSKEELRNRIQNESLLPLVLTTNPLQSVLEEILDLIDKQANEIQILKDDVATRAKQDDLNNLSDKVDQNKKDADNQLENLKKEYHDDPVFAKSKIVFSTYNDKFEGELDKDFATKVMTEGIVRKDVALIKEPTHTNVNKLAFQYADGIIFNHKDVDDELREFASTLKKPTLEYPGEDTYIDAYSAFFDKIIG